MLFLLIFSGFTPEYLYLEEDFILKKTSDLIIKDVFEMKGWGQWFDSIFRPNFERNENTQEPRFETTRDNKNLNNFIQDNKDYNGSPGSNLLNDSGHNAITLLNEWKAEEKKELNDVIKHIADETIRKTLSGGVDPKGDNDFDVDPLNFKFGKK